MKSKKHVHSSFIEFSVILSQLFTPSAQMIHIVYKGLFVSIDSNFLISNLNYTQKQNKKISMCRTLTPSDSKSQTFICSSMQVYDSQLGNRARRGEVVIFHLMFRGDQWSETQNINQCYSWLSIYFTKCTNHTLFQPPHSKKCMDWTTFLVQPLLCDRRNERFSKNIKSNFYLYNRSSRSFVSTIIQTNYHCGSL